VKRNAVIKRIKTADRRAGVPIDTKELTNHTGLIVGTVHTTLSRHTEIAEGTAEALYKQLEPALGKGWWRR